MQVLQALAGYSFGRADVVRRAMAKKKHDVMEQERTIFINGLTDEEGRTVVDGCIKRGVPAATANRIFDEMASFASYAFNKSHAAAYALVAYQTAYLKCLYPQEYMAALLTSVLGSSKTVTYIRECERMGIRVLPPSVNESGPDFTGQGKDIRFGLLAVKNIGRSFVDVLVREREQNGPFAGLYDFCKRLAGQRECNRLGVDSLIRCGAFDGLGLNRRQMLQMAPVVMGQVESQSRSAMDGQVGFFDEAEKKGDSPIAAPDLPEMSFAELLQMEKDAAGMYLTGHPLTPYKDHYKPMHANRLDRILGAIEDGSAAYTDGTVVRLLCMVDTVRTQTTKSGAKMGYAQVEDLYGSIDTVVFPKLWSRHENQLQPGQVLFITGRLDIPEEQEPKLMVDRIEPVPEKPPTEAAAPAGAVRPSAPAQKPQKLFLRLPTAAGEVYAHTHRLLAVFEGPIPVYIRFADTEKMVRTPQSWWVDPQPILLQELIRLLGPDNVVLQ